MTMTPHLQRGLTGGFVAAVLALLAVAANAAGIPPAYTPLVIEPMIAEGRSEFDLGPALARAKRENKRLYVYLGASDCPYCRRYENFMRKNADELVPHFKPCLLYTSPSPRDRQKSRMPSSA